QYPYDIMGLINKRGVTLIPSFEKRVRAFAIDTSGVMIFVILAIAFPKGIVQMLFISVPFLVFYLLPYFLSNGQSFGKRVQKIKIVKLDGSDAELPRVLAREIFKVGLSIFTAGVYLIVAYFFLSEKKDSRTIHDFVFKTKMIDLSQREYDDDYLNKTPSIRKRGL
ncbi:MAG: RDD family protein, partial [Acholeplasmataceae bacterium]|nr:RDD family protein [Acholeplasmataceae bacterium]